MARILIIDEALELRIALTRFLAALGHEVVALASAEDVIGPDRRLIASDNFDVAILEVAGPDARTLRLVAILKGIFAGLKIVVSAKPEVAAAFDGPASLSRALGAAAAIFKPFTAAQLSGTLDRLLDPSSNGSDSTSHE